MLSAFAVLHARGGIVQVAEGGKLLQFLSWCAASARPPPAALSRAPLDVQRAHERVRVWEGAVENTLFNKRNQPLPVRQSSSHTHVRSRHSVATGRVRARGEGGGTAMTSVSLCASHKKMHYIFDTLAVMRAQPQSVRAHVSVQCGNRTRLCVKWFAPRASANTISSGSTATPHTHHTSAQTAESVLRSVEEAALRQDKRALTFERFKCTVWSASTLLQPVLGDRIANVAEHQ